MRELGNSVCVLHSIFLIFIFSIFYILWFVAPLRFTAFVNEGAIKDFKFCLELLQAYPAVPSGILLIPVEHTVFTECVKSLRRKRKLEEQTEFMSIMSSEV